MKYFTEDYLEFFKELAANNHKEWFDLNRKQYQKSVKEPFEKYVSDLINEIRKMDSAVQIKPSDAIFRINRDVRFSADKSLYKLDRSAVISPEGRKNHTLPGFYLSFGPEKATFGGGVYGTDTKDLEKIRNYIARNSTEFTQLLNEQSFRSFYKEIKGEESKRLPKELQEAAKQQVHIFKKQFYYMADNSPELILREDLMQLSLDHYHAGLKMQDYLRNALK